MKGVVNALRIISILVFIFALYWLLSVIVFQPWQPATPGTLDPLPYPFTTANPEINIWNAWLYFFIFSFGILGHLFTGGMVAFPYDWTYFWDNFSVSIYYFGFEMCIIVAVISMVMFLRKCDPNWAFRAFIFMIGMLILTTLTQYANYLNPASYVPAAYASWLIPLWIIGFSILGLLLIKKAIGDLFQKKSRSIFYLCFAFFIITTGYTSAGLFTTIPSFYFDSLSNSIINLDIVSFLTNPIFLAAFFTFLFLEITYLTSYNYTVGTPAMERERIIDKQLQQLQILGAQSTEQLKTQAKLHSISIRRFFSSEAFDFMREVIEKGVYDKEVQTRMVNLRDYQHLQAYLEDLYIKDPGARNSLTATGSLPSAKRVAKASLIGTTWRVGLVFILIIVCFSPLAFFNILSFIFPSLVTSYLEISTIAAVILLTIPLVLLFPVIGTVIKLRQSPKIEEATKEISKAEKIVAIRSGTA
ncbi:MAG: hypothetical protein ACFFD2_02880 [Promethearchaeota archaeon]